MKNITIIYLLLLSSLCFAQIDKELTKARWKVGTEKIIDGHVVGRFLGENGTAGMTNLSFETIGQIRAGIEETAKKEMWTDAQKKQKLFIYDKFAGTSFDVSGQLHLYLTRLTIDAANTENFTVIVNDSTDAEIYRQTLSSNIPQVPSEGSDYWWNYTIVNIPKKLPSTFFVYVIDALGSDNGKFKFRVKL